jgi:archaellum biogenesis protein FlaJ (TadC family)
MITSTRAVVTSLGQSVEDQGMRMTMAMKQIRGHSRVGEVRQEISRKHSELE